MPRVMMVTREANSCVFAVQQPVIRMYDDWRALAATKGVRVADPAAQLPDADAAVRMFGEAGFEDIQVSRSWTAASVRVARSFSTGHDAGRWSTDLRLRLSACKKLPHGCAYGELQQPQLRSVSADQMEIIPCLVRAALGRVGAVCFIPYR